MPDYGWPAMDKRRLLGKRTNRVDGFVKASGKAKYGYDIRRPGMLYGAILTSPHAHARIVKIDTSAAEAMKGVTAVEVVSAPGTEVQWAGTEIVAVAATSETIARDALRKVKVEYEVLPHMVREQDYAKPGARVKRGGESVTGQPDAAFAEAEVTSEGHYGIPVITHCTMETHGQVIEWKGANLDYWPSTQNVSGLAGELGKSLSIPAANIHVMQEHMGIGFGSKFSPDRWATVCANLSKKSGGRAVRLFLDRATDLEIAGNRPGFFANIKVGGKKDGSITAWQSETWGTGGVGGGGLAPGLLPYVFTKVPNRRFLHSTVSINTGGARAWRAPNHPQVSYLTCAAIEDFAAAAKLDPLDVFLKNTEFTARPSVYRAQLEKAAEIAEWKKLWHPRDEKASGHMRRGLGIGVCTWGGAGHDSKCEATIHADGSVEVKLGSQDLGTGTRTVINMVAAETLGLPLGAVKVLIGDNKYPPSGSSGGSTTVGGVSSSTRKATMNALAKLYEVVAPSLGAAAEQLEAADGKIQVKGNPAKSLTWRAACRKLGTKTISEIGHNNPQDPMGLNTGGVGGVQIADVSVDIETGVVKMNRMVAVQDCGLVINPKTAESQIYGGCILSIASSLFEERVMDQLTGRMLNADMEFYKLAGIGDIGEIIVHLDISPEHDKRGVIGLGEPPTIGGIGAIANAVANAIGVRPSVLPLTPDKVLGALEGRKA
jgi:xanthine dehydrogenase YagR molybdenum-binding subunit